MTWTRLSTRTANRTSGLWGRNVHTLYRICMIYTLCIHNANENLGLHGRDVISFIWVLCHFQHTV